MRQPLFVRWGGICGVGVAGTPPAATPPPPFSKGGLWSWLMPKGVCVAPGGRYYSPGVGQRVAPSVTLRVTAPSKEESLNGLGVAERALRCLGWRHHSPGVGQRLAPSVTLRVTAPSKEGAGVRGGSRGMGREPDTPLTGERCSRSLRRRIQRTGTGWHRAGC